MEKKRSMRIFIILYLCFSGLAAAGQSVPTAKPWTYWWWMGSAVSEQDIRYQLTTFAKTGLGGVHIIPIYGVKGNESNNISFLTDRWLAMLTFTVKEGRRLGLGVDMTTGTGWPFGGPNVSSEFAAQQMSYKDGQILIAPTRQQVKRAAPGGAGPVLDPFGAHAMARYLSRFDSAFVSINERPRSMYMDSYEAYGANWTADFTAEFKRRRGYDIADKISLLTVTGDQVDAALIKIDYHLTLAELLRERYASVWTKWSTANKFLTRYQAHGSPGNLLDLYDIADIPETESFGTSRFPIPGLRVDPDYSVDQFGTPNVLAMKFASSAAHFSGKSLVSAETGTWLANHFKVSLSQIKPQVDELFTAGINHIFYHGTTYSPEKEPYPGWLFYASTNFGPMSHFAGHLSLLNQYVEKCQNLLQTSKPDHDVLVYFPINDLWSTPSKSAGGVHLLEVHHVDRWLLDLPFGKLAERLWKHGYSFDYVSDLQLERLDVDANGNLSSGNTTYKTLVIPVCKYMPEQTLAQLLRLAAAGAKIIFEDKLPEHVAGFSSHAQRQQLFLQNLDRLRPAVSIQPSQQLDKMLIQNGAVREEMTEKGLTYIRKKDANGRLFYFVANLGNQFKKDWVQLGLNSTISKYDPLRGQSLLSVKKESGYTKVLLSLLPGESCFLMEAANGAKIPEESGVEEEVEITGDWNLEFLEGKPSIPSPAVLNKLESWTTLPNSAVYFSGRARYSIHFDALASLVRSNSLAIHLGDVREVASVKLNGKSVGVAWHIPYNLVIPPGILKQKNNLLEIEVTNLSANYMRLRDTQGPEWKKFDDINIVDITYKKFSASNWDPMPSGLLGPVKLVFGR
jgi:hypothetical protein